MKASTINQRILKNKTKVTETTNHILLLVDTSGSMSPYTSQINKYLRQQLFNINKVSSESNQKTIIHCKTFSTDFDRDYVSVDVNINDPSGNIINNTDTRLGWNSTPLLKAIKESNQFLNEQMSDNDIAMLLVITDGLENASNMTPLSLANNVTACKFFDRITYALAGPDSSKEYFNSNELGPIFSDNFTAWDTSTKGFNNITTSTNNAVNNYYHGVTRGITKMSKVFIDMSAVNKKDLKSLRSIPYNFKSWKVDSEQRIDDFINNKLTMPTNKRVFGSVYRPGNGFYQLTKAEKIQENKLLIIKDKATNKYYYGSTDIREVLGLPLNATTKVEPNNLGNFELYIQSTSTNRKLVRGTNLIYVTN